MTAPGMPAPLVVPLPPSALAAAQPLTHSNPAPAPTGQPAQPLPHASEAASLCTRSGASLGAAQPGRLRLSRSRSGAAEPASPGLHSAKSGAAEPPSPCFSASSRSSTDSRSCQPHMNPVLWPRARRPLQALDPTNKTRDPDPPAASARGEPLQGGGAGFAGEALVCSGEESAGERQLRTIRVCADSVCGMQVSEVLSLLDWPYRFCLYCQGYTRHGNVWLNICVHTKLAAYSQQAYSCFDDIHMYLDPLCHDVEQVLTQHKFFKNK